MPKKKTHEQFIEELSKVNSKVEVLGTYVNTHTNYDNIGKIIQNIF